MRINITSANLERLKTVSLTDGLLLRPKSTSNEDLPVSIEIPDETAEKLVQYF